MQQSGFTRYKFGVQYYGPRFSGWSSNPEAKFPSVSSVLYNAFENFLGKENFKGVHGSSRTDAGVHALKNCFHVDISNAKSYGSENIRRALNQRLNPDYISIVEVLKCSPEFDSRKDAICRSYMYRIYLSHGNQCDTESSLFERWRAWIIHDPLSIDDMKCAAQHFLGKHDFSAFRNSGCQSKYPVKNILKINLSQKISNLVSKLTHKTKFPLLIL